jgi:biopolymer transport protein ExbD
MSWKIRHEGSPRSIDVASLQQVVEGMQDGLWETTDEVMGPEDKEWVAIENHPQLADVAMDLEPPVAAAHEDETRLDMNPLIDVALVLLIFFILTTSYAALQRLLEMPKMKDDDPTKVVRVTPEDVKKLTIWVKVQKGNDKPVFLIEDKVVAEKDLLGELSRFVKDTRKTEMLLDVQKGVDWGTVVAVQDAAKGAGIQHAHYLVPVEK